MTSDTSSIRSHGGIREPRRLSIEEYYGRILERPTNRDTVQEPPDYDLALEGLRVPPSAVKISPRKDEGYETLPSYTCSIMIQAVFQRKMELESAVQRADDRNWSKVFLKIQGTALQVYKVKNLGMFSKEHSDPILNPDLPPYLRAGDLLRTYSLQYAEVGIAADYVKRRFVIRVRVEAEQFLLSCIEMETFLKWLEMLTAAIDLAPPLDERKLPVDYSMPRTTRRQRRISAASESEGFNDGLLRPEHASNHHSQLAEVSEEGSQDGESERGGLPSPIYTIRSTSHTPTGDGPARSGFGYGPPAPAWGTPQVNQQSNSDGIPIVTPENFPYSSPPHIRQQALKKTLRPNQSITADGKWKPVHNWSPTYDMMYAKKCMALLLARTPRKTNIIIMKGKRWIIEPSGSLTRCDPPDYED